MSKVIYLSDVKQTLLEMSKEKTRSVGWGDVLMERLKDSSFEVSEGEWIKVDYSEEPMCSNCGTFHYGTYTWYYCPNCGAKMKGKEE